MKIALPSRDGQIDSHFGHCEYFTIVSVDDNNAITAQERLAPPPGCGCKSNIIPLLAERGVRLMLAGTMGDGAVAMLQRFGIDVVRGCSGAITAVVEDYLAGALSDSAAGCADHGGCPGH
jgi:predicted Fe-Mo cluster-binding NifX family protein